MVAKIQAHFHPWIPTPNHQHSLPSKLCPTLVQTCVLYGPTKFPHSLNLRHHCLCILPGGHNQPPTDKLSYQLPLVETPHLPKPESGIKLSMPNGLIEPWPNGKPLSVALQILYELLLCGVCGEVTREPHQREFTKLLWQVEVKPVIGLQLPQRCYAVGSLQD